LQKDYRRRSNEATLQKHELSGLAGVSHWFAVIWHEIGWN
jgi:hypothetical protein